jgi:uncharacterized protein (DUF1697 family)
LTTWVALLRGVNVGGHNKIPMAELRKVCASLGFASVTTYIQSGNVVFRADGRAEELADRLRAAIAERFGCDVPIVLRTATDLDRVLAGNPFTHADEDTSRLHVGFLAGVPSAETVAAMPPKPPGRESFHVAGGEVYLLYPDGMGRSKLTTAYFDRALGTTMTARNWRTVTRLAEMARDA